MQTATVGHMTQEPKTPIFDEDGLHSNISEHVNDYLASRDNPPIFRTNANVVYQAVPGEDKCAWNRSALFTHFLSQLPVNEKAEYTCACCRNFIKKVGSLVVLDPVTYLPKSLLWESGIIGDKFKNSFDALRNVVEKSDIIEVFQTDKTEFGRQYAGGFAHMHLKLAQPVHKTHCNKSPERASGMSRQDFNLLKASLDLYKPELIKSALTLFRNHQKLTQGYPKFEDRLEIILKLTKDHQAFLAPKVKTNLIWKAVALNTPDIIHFGNTVLGKFLDSLANNQAEEAVLNFIKNTKRETYLRPQALPKAGTVVTANKIIAEKGLARSFERRQAQLDDIKVFKWKPTIIAPNKTTSPGFFSDVATQASKVTPRDLPHLHAGTMTWVKFAKTYLHQANNIHLQVPSGLIENWTGVVTAVHSDCVPILRGDTLEDRQHLSIYSIIGGSVSENWGLRGFSKVPVVGIITPPGHTEKEGEDSPALLLIEDAGNQPGLCLFPELLQPELYEIRSVVEEYSKTHPLTLSPKPISAFYMGVKHNGTTFIVETDDAHVTVVVDRFD